MRQFGFLRAAAACPEVKVADCRFNAERTLEQLHQAEDMGVDLIVFPELGLTGYTCHDLFHDQTLQRTAVNSLQAMLAAAEQAFGGIAVVGIPLPADGMLFNAAIVFRGGRILGAVPKTFLPTYKEFYEGRYFAPAAAVVSETVTIAGQTVPFGTDLLFHVQDDEELVLGVEICEDLWTPVPPSSLQAIAGATVLVNLSASDETIGKATYRRNLVAQQSARCIAGYVYAASGVGESTTDVVYGGHCMLAENGGILAESERFRRTSHLTVADFDIERLTRDRAMTGSFHGNRADPERSRKFRRIRISPLPDRENRTPELIRTVDPAPFVPSDPATLRERCEEIFQTQVTGLAKRLEYAGRPKLVIGISGGLDSTLALLATCKVLDLLDEPRDRLTAFTMPGFGTTPQTKANALALIQAVGVSLREIDIRKLTLDQLKAMNHAPFGIPLEILTLDNFNTAWRILPAERKTDVVFENVQARVRTSLLMNSGFVIGTGDLSEIALGWCTYNADHMSMYNPNAGIPKTLVKFLVEWSAENDYIGSARKTLLDIAATPIGPELLPVEADGTNAQATESAVGPYELVDFFLYHFLRFGTAPDKILFLARRTEFSREYSEEELHEWLTVFLRRFFANQFKRSALPDGPKVGSISLSPRGDWRMSSDAEARAWLEAAEQG